MALAGQSAWEAGRGGAAVGAEVKGRGGVGGVRALGMAVIGGVFGLLRGSSPAEGAAGKCCPPHSWLLPARERGLWGAAVTGSLPRAL